MFITKGIKDVCVYFENETHKSNCLKRLEKHGYLTVGGDKPTQYKLTGKINDICFHENNLIEFFTSPKQEVKNYLRETVNPNIKWIKYFEDEEMLKEELKGRYDDIKSEIFS